MKRVLLRTSSFIRSARRIIRKDPAIAEDIRAALTLLTENAFHPALKTHKLKGNLEGSRACSAGYDHLNSCNTRGPKPSSLKQSERIKKFIKARESQVSDLGKTM